MHWRGGGLRDHGAASHGGPDRLWSHKCGRDLYHKKRSADGTLCSVSTDPWCRKCKIFRACRTGTRCKYKKGGVRETPVLFIFQYRPFQCVVACHAPDERCDEHPECGVHRYASVWAESGYAYFCDIVCIPDQFDAGAGLSCGTADVSSAFNSYYYQCRAALRAHAECDRSGEPVYSGKSYSNPCCEILCQRRLRSGKVRCRQ